MDESNPGRSVVYLLPQPSTQLCICMSIRLIGTCLEHAFSQVYTTIVASACDCSWQYGEGLGRNLKDNVLSTVLIRKTVVGLSVCSKPEGKLLILYIHIHVAS